MKKGNRVRNLVLIDPYRKCPVPSCMAWTKLESGICGFVTWDDRHWEYVTRRNVERRQSA